VAAEDIEAAGLQMDPVFEGVIPDSRKGIPVEGLAAR
jgi:hypothetical protein